VRITAATEEAIRRVRETGMSRAAAERFSGQRWSLRKMISRAVDAAVKAAAESPEPPASADVTPEELKPNE
jgi:hypothetical protein